MLKRYQVLLPNWLEEYFKLGVDRYGFSFSEIIRLQICFSVLAQIPIIHPEYKPKLSLDDILSYVSQSVSKHPTKKEYDRFVSQIYFETRKAIEYRTKKLNEKSKQ